MIDLKQIQYFIVCAQKHSFSSAAKELFTTQPNVSKAIKALEEELGFLLFERHNRGISLTEDGEKVYEYAVCICDNLNEIGRLKKTKKADCK